MDKKEIKQQVLQGLDKRAHDLINTKVKENNMAPKKEKPNDKD